MSSELQHWIAECELYNRRKAQTPAQSAPMQTTQIARPMELWAVDIMGILPVTARGNQCILVMSDHFTKWVEAIPIVNQCADTVARAFVDEVVARHGIPEKTDLERNFESELMK